MCKVVSWRARGAKTPTLPAFIVCSGFSEFVGADWGRGQQKSDGRKCSRYCQPLRSPTVTVLYCTVPYCTVGIVVGSYAEHSVSLFLVRNLSSSQQVMHCHPYVYCLTIIVLCHDSLLLLSVMPSSRQGMQCQSYLCRLIIDVIRHYPLLLLSVMIP